MRNDEAWTWIDIWGTAWAEVFSRGGIRMHYPAAFGQGGRVRGGDDERGEILNQSKASRLRCAFALAEATCRWGWVSTLTVPRVVSDGAAAKIKRRLFDGWSPRWGEAVDAWVMEFQARGAIHFHLFHARESNFGTHCAVASQQTFAAGTEHERTVLRGGVDFWLVDRWKKILGKGLWSDAAEKFNRGGLIEPLRTDDGAARYVSSEASKPHQKRLPEFFDGGAGRWWWVNPRWKPRLVGTQEVDLDKFPHATPVKHIFDGETIAHCLAGEYKPVDGNEENKLPKGGSQNRVLATEGREIKG